MAELYNLESLERGLLVMLKHSEYLSCSPKNKGKFVPGVNIPELKLCVAQIAVFISEAARAEAVFDFIMKQKPFPKYVMFYIFNWSKEQRRFGANEEGYMNDLRIAQLRSKEDKKLIKKLVQDMKVKEEAEAAAQFKLTKKALQKESSSPASSSSTTLHKTLMYSIQNHKYRLVLLNGGMVTTIEDLADVITGTLALNKLTVDKNLADVESFAKPPSVMIETSTADSAISLSQHDSSISVHSATTYVPPPSTIRSVSMRDMGTEMTPIASQEPSRTGTPVRATTPIRSSGSSRPPTPGKAAPALTHVNASDLQVDASKKELSEKKLQKRTRREIMAFGTQLGKMSIAAWASKKEEDEDASTLLKIVAVDQTPKNVIETQAAAASEEAEKAKYTARYKREELKIMAWENHQKAKMEAEMRKVEGNLLGCLQVDQSTVAIKGRSAKVVEEELEKAMYAYGYEIVQTLMVDIEPDERVQRAMNEIGAASESSAVFIPHGPGAVRDVAAQIREGLLQASSTQ